MQRTRFCIAAALVLSGALWRHAAVADDTAADKPPIVLIVIDTLRADHLGCYGYTPDTSPTMDDIASHAFLFENAIAAAPWTVPSMASLFTSAYPSEHGVLKHGDKKIETYGLRVTNVLSDGWQTLAETLKHGGYTTAGFVANPWLNEHFGYAQGFDHYDVVRRQGASPYESGDKLNARVTQWLDRLPQQQRGELFLYVHYMDVHGPYNAPKEYRAPFEDPLRAQLEAGTLTPVPEGFRQMHAQAMYDAYPPLLGYQELYAARYDGGIRYVDKHVEQLRDALREIGLWDEAFVVITADHGQEMCEHGGGGHGYTLFTDQLHVPLIVKPPHSDVGVRISATVSLLDVMPAICDAAGVDPPERSHGRSLLPMLETAAARKDAFAFAEGVRAALNQVAVRLADRKVILDIASGDASFYDLSADPREQSPSHTPPDATAVQMRDALERWVRTTRTPQPDTPEVADPAAIDPELANTLKSLGYLSDDD